MKSPFNIYLVGVGGQGIGLLSETLLRAADYAGIPVLGVDTHGLAQRGGTVSSHLRLGPGAHSPLVPKGGADMVIALERHEAFRAMNSYLKDGGVLAYYDAQWQPLPVRLGGLLPNESLVVDEAQRRSLQVLRVFNPGLKDPRTQNIALLSEIARLGLVPMIESGHYEKALEDLLPSPLFEINLALLRNGANVPNTTKEKNDEA